MLRVLHLTDPHLFADPGGALRGTVTYASLEAVLEDYRDGDWRADVVLVTGDLIQDDSAEAYAHFRKLLGTLGIPVVCLPGNHDVRPLMRDALAAAPFQYCGTFAADGWLILCLDSVVDGVAGGRLEPAEFEQLDDALAAADAGHVLVALHHPLAAMGSKWLDSVGLANADEALERLRAHDRVRLCLFGHVHQDFEDEHEGIRIIATPSTCRQFLPGSTRFSVDDLPPAYRRVELNPDGSFGHELVWVDYECKQSTRGSDEPFY